jgi:hypothetical protein
VLVRAHGADLPSDEEMIDVTASVRTVDDAAWERFISEAAGGPGLHADPAETELDRGDVDGVGWLLQTGRGKGLPVDPCLKLSDGQRACPPEQWGEGQADSMFVMSSAMSSFADVEFPPFLIVVTRTPGEQLRVRTPSTTATGVLQPLPDGTGWAGLVFVDAVSVGMCGDSPNPDWTQVDVLDASGAVVGCVGDPW